MLQIKFMIVFVTESKTLPTSPPEVCYACRIGKKREPELGNIIGQIDKCKEVCWLHPQCLNIVYQVGRNSCSLFACLETSKENGDGYEVIRIREGKFPFQMSFG